MASAIMRLRLFPDRGEAQLDSRIWKCERSFERMIQVVKRDGELAEFSLNKITEAIKKAYKATAKDYNIEILELKTQQEYKEIKIKKKNK